MGIALVRPLGWDVSHLRGQRVGSLPDLFWAPWALVSAQPCWPRRRGPPVVARGWVPAAKRSGSLGGFAPRLLHWTTDSILACGASPPRAFWHGLQRLLHCGKVISERPPKACINSRFSRGWQNEPAGSVPLSGWYAAAVRYHLPVWAPYIYPPFCGVLMQPLARLSFTSALARLERGYDISGCRCDVYVAQPGWSTHPRQTGADALASVCSRTTRFPMASSSDRLPGSSSSCSQQAMALLSRNRVWPSALCFALAALIKLTPVLAVPILILHRRWKWLMAYAVWMISLLTLSI